MSAKRFTLDTNILVYAVDKSDEERHLRVQEVIEAMLTQDCVLTLQSLGEFYFTVTRKGRLPPIQEKNRLKVGKHCSLSSRQALQLSTGRLSLLNSINFPFGTRCYGVPHAMPV